MTMKVTDRFAAPLAAQLGAIDVEDLIEAAYDIAVEEQREALRHELEAEGAPREVIDAVDIIPEERYMHATVGVAGDHPAADAAEDFEYGDVDNAQAPHGVFRYMSDDMALIAAEELASNISGAISG
jgi:hypothetical protein